MLASGTVTLVFTDIESSSSRWEADAPGMRLVLSRHDEILRAAIATFGGSVCKHTGDGMCAAFTSAPDALAAAETIQTALAAEPWSGGIPLRVRIWLHTGTASPTGETISGRR